MIAEFMRFVLDCFVMVVRLFQNTVIDGISYEVLIVASWMLSIVIGAIIIRFRPSFRPPKPSRSPAGKTNSDDPG